MGSKRGPSKEERDKRSAQIPLSIRLLVRCEYEWYNMNIKEDRGHTLEEEIEAQKWSEYMTKKLLTCIEKWQQDGAELNYNKNK